MIVGKFGGVIDFTSEPKIGSTFYYTIELEPDNQSNKDLSAKRQSTKQTYLFDFSVPVPRGTDLVSALE